MKNLFDTMADAILAVTDNHVLFGHIKNGDHSILYVPVGHTERRADGVRVYCAEAEDYANMLEALGAVKGGEA